MINAKDLLVVGSNDWFNKSGVEIIKNLFEPQEWAQVKKECIEINKKGDYKASIMYLNLLIDEHKPKFILFLGATYAPCFANTTLQKLKNKIHLYESIPCMFVMALGVVKHNEKQRPILEVDLKAMKYYLDNESIPTQELNWVLVDNRDKLGNLMDSLQESEIVAFDVETSGLDYREENFKIYCLGLYCSYDNTSYLLPLEYPNSIYEFNSQEVIDLIFSSVDTTHIKFIAHNGKFDNKCLYTKYGIKFPIHFDTMLAHHLIDENSPHGLKFLSKVILNAPDYDIDAGSIDPNTTPLHIVCRYCGFDVLYTYQLYLRFKNELENQPRVYNLFNKITMPLAQVFEEAELRGFCVDRPKLLSTREKLKLEIDELLNELNMKSLLEDGTLPVTNWNSTKQVGNFLFNILKLPIIEYTKTGGPSTSGESVLPKLKEYHPIVGLLLDYREKIKLHQFLNSWDECTFYDDKTKSYRLKTNWKINGTTTGRLSSGKEGSDG